MHTYAHINIHKYMIIMNANGLRPMCVRQYESRGAN